MENELKRPSELIRLFVNPHIPTKEEFHEVTPTQLEEYITETKEKKSKSEHKRNKYHELAIMAKVDHLTTEAELERLLHSDVRTLIVQKNYNSPKDFKQICEKIEKCVDRFYSENQHRTPIGVAVEINGELLISGRMRNNRSVFLEMGHIIVLTNNKDYQNCCFKEILYVSNLWRYSEVVGLGDVFVMGAGSQIVTKVVKCGPMQSITVKVMKPGLLTSFMRCKLPYYIEAKELSEKDIADIDEAVKNGAHFLMIPGIKSAPFLKFTKEHIGEDIGLLGSIDLEYLESKFIDMADFLLELDGVVLNDIIYPASQKLLANPISQCKHLQKPMIGRVPLDSCKDFKKLENHMRFKQMDCLLIQKSPLRQKFPLIAKKLLPVGNLKLNLPPIDSLSCKDGIINFVLRIIYSIPCQGLVITNSCSKAAVAFSYYQIYCPVIVVVDNDQMARVLNLRKNLKTVICGDKNLAMDLGIDFGRKQGIFTTGDFIISISDSLEANSQVCVNLRAHFLPPIVQELFS
ncbi:uncharacterized protein LOC129947747 [Eupeodes corollae]|uniref:uncharacterized protein LOC129947747 n=1 Tax=Eupeodes corollae TaxID=290404 RepID=UPI002491299B|nr:uncharacterized protein LOC129947747 [Eupeodes corollae]